MLYLRKISVKITYVLPALYSGLDTFYLPFVNMMQGCN